jgi:ASC-1-like (ASCH) protein
VRTHRLKTLTQYFENVQNGRKSAELRLNDRDYQVGDILVLEGYDANDKLYVGGSVTKQITHILSGCRGLEPGYCVLSLDEVSE